MQITTIKKLLELKKSINQSIDSAKLYGSEAIQLYNLLEVPSTLLTDEEKEIINEIIANNKNVIEYCEPYDYKGINENYIIWIA